MSRIAGAMFAVAGLIALLVIAGCGDDGETIFGVGSADLAFHVAHPDREVDYRIHCGPDGSTVTGDEVEIVPEAACDALADEAVLRRLVDGPPADQICTEIYGGPDTAVVTGAIDEESVDTVVDRKNGCGIHDWDVLLRSLLPMAMGVTP